MSTGSTDIFQHGHDSPVAAIRWMAPPHALLAALRVATGKTINASRSFWWPRHKEKLKGQVKDEFSTPSRLADNKNVWWDSPSLPFFFFLSFFSFSFFTLFIFLSPPLSHTLFFPPPSSAAHHTNTQGSPFPAVHPSHLVLFSSHHRPPPSILVVPLPPVCLSLTHTALSS